MSVAVTILAALLLLWLLAEHLRAKRVIVEPLDDEDIPSAPLEPIQPEPEVVKTTGTLLDYAEHGGLLGGESSAVGRPAEHARGVLYQGPWQHPADGFQTHTRRVARALASTGVPVHLRAIMPLAGATATGSEEERIEESMRDLAHASIAQYSVLVQQVIPVPGFLDRITTPTALGAQIFTPEQWAQQLRARVLYVVYERAPVPPGDLVALRKVGQVWVACERDAEELRRSGVEGARVKVIPVPFASDDPLLSLRDRERSPGRPRLYHIGKWEPRKAGDRILGAFMRAFAPGEAELYMKTSLLNCSFDGWPSTPEVALAARIRDPKVKQNGWTLNNLFDDITIQTDVLPAAELVKIHAWGDVYCSLSRGEGFDMPGLDAKIAGNLLVYTPSGGPQDYALDSDVRVEPSGTVPCHPVYAWGADARYLDFDVSAAAEAMQAAVAKIGQVKAGPVDQTRLADFSSARVGKKVRDALQELVGPDGRLS